MKLDYATLISPYPLRLEGIGSIKSPTLKEIWDPSVTYQGYQMYLTLLLMTPQTYYEQTGLSRSEWFQTISEDEIQNINMMDLIAVDGNLQKMYCNMFQFFFEETIQYDDGNHIFITYKDKKQDGAKSEKNHSMGTIRRDIFVELCDIILQRCNILRTDIDTDTSKIKSKRALEIVKKLKKGRENASKNATHDKDVELPNLITSVAVKSNSINFTNIWDLTVFQLYEQFKKEQTNVYFDIQKMSVAAYGNEKNTFKGNEWYKSEN